MSAHRIHRRFVSILGALLACAVVSPVAAQTFPARPITFVVPAAPGGILDQSARLVAGELSKLVGQPVVVENKAGASQIIGAQAVARAMAESGVLAARVGLEEALTGAGADSTALDAVFDALTREARSATPRAFAADSLGDGVYAATIVNVSARLDVNTAGAEGLAAAVQDGEAFDINAISVKVISTHGAGDCFVGTLAARLAEGRDLRAACEAAVAAAARHVAGEG